MGLRVQWRVLKQENALKQQWIDQHFTMPIDGHWHPGGAATGLPKMCPVGEVDMEAVVIDSRRNEMRIVREDVLACVAQGVPSDRRQACFKGLQKLISIRKGP
jgi:hypothetical protein